MSMDLESLRTDELGEFKVLVGDSLELMKTIDDELIDCVITDPPYLGFRFTQENYFEMIEPFATEMIRCTRLNHRIAISQPNFRLDQISLIFDSKRILKIPDAFEDERKEEAFFLLKNPLRDQKIEAEMWTGFEKTTHPNPRDINKMAVLVKMMSNPGETILDPFCGSGAIGLAAVMLGRNYLGIELIEARAEDARQRYDALRASL